MRWRVLCALVFLVFGTLPGSVHAESRNVVEILIRGNKKIETDAILSRLRTKVGAELSRDNISEDIRSIAKLRFFEGIEAEEETVPGGVRLIFNVVEKPTISKIEYQGLDSVDKDDLKDLILVKEYEVLDIQKLSQSVEKLTQKYEEKGFYLADVHYTLEPDPKRGEVKVIFQIEENDKVQVKQINLVGANVVPVEDLKKVMQTKEGGFFSFITGSGSYREAVFERDIATLGYYYGTLGYVRARFGKPEVTVTPDKKWVYITFFVEEGQQYNVGKVDFSGDLLYRREELVEDLALVQGETFNTETLRKETLRYTEKYSDLGYAFANVVPQPVIHDDTKTVDVTFEIDRGERVYIGKITVTGNTRTKDKVLRRELLIHEGELFNGTKKRLSRENVVRLGFFDNVEFHQSTSKVAPNIVDIEIKVKERSTGQLVVGAGYASGDIGFTINAQLSQNNFLGNGQVASLSAEILTGRKYYQFALGFQDPYVGYSNWSLGGDLFQLRRNLIALEDVPTFEETKTGFDIKLGHPVYEFTNLFLTYKLENSYVPEASIIDRKLIPKDSVNGVSSSLNANVVYDKRDDRFDPRTGAYFSLSGEYAGLGGRRQFFRSRGQLKFFHPIVWDFIFRLNMTAANITGSSVPINELFIQGGLFSLRGYDFLTIGPAQTLSPASSGNISAKGMERNVGGRTFTVGGHNEVLMQAEIEFPILKEARIRGVVFMDAGNAFDLPFRGGPALYANLGWGFRWFTPIGPLRFEFGYPIVKNASSKFYFTIGPAF